MRGDPASIRREEEGRYVGGDVRRGCRGARSGGPSRSPALPTRWHGRREGQRRRASIEGLGRVSRGRPSGRWGMRRVLCGACQEETSDDSMKVLLPTDVVAMRRGLLGWHARHGRTLRFRGTTDPWLVLVSEVMAQQTQIARVEVAWASFTTPLPHTRGLRGGLDRGRPAGVGGPRIQPASAEPPARCPGHRRRSRRPRPVRPRDPRDAARGRSIHGPSGRGDRVRSAGRRGRHEHPTTGREAGGRSRCDASGAPGGCGRAGRSRPTPRRGRMRRWTSARRSAWRAPRAVVRARSARGA